MKIKFQTLLPWMGEIITAIKKDIKSDYLSSDPAFCRKHFGTLPQSRITTDEIVAAFSKELIAGDEDMAEWVVHRWLERNEDLYEHFAERLFEINPEFDKIKLLSPSESSQVLDGAKESFGAKNVYLLSVMNGVVFPEEVFATLRKDAEEETRQIEADEIAAVEAKKAAIVAKEQAKLDGKIKAVKAQIASAKTESDREKLKEKLAKLENHAR
jgi:hypothetical protein